MGWYDAFCRRCYGTGLIFFGVSTTWKAPCPECLGSGAHYHYQAYRP